MGIKRRKPEEVATKLRHFEVLRGQGMSMADGVLGNLDQTANDGAWFKAHRPEKGDSLTGTCHNRKG